MIFFLARLKEYDLGVVLLPVILLEVADFTVNLLLGELLKRVEGGIIRLGRTLLLLLMVLEMGETMVLNWGPAPSLRSSWCTYHDPQLLWKRLTSLLTTSSTILARWGIFCAHAY
jgi:hypothetical protein